MDTIQRGHAKRLDQLAELLQARLPAEQQAPVEAFARHYFSQVAAEDLDEREVADLYGAVLSHWGFARRRRPGETRVRVFNPTISEHGWQSTHTLVEIVNDDMPFLVDSVSMEVNRHGLTLHLIVHPLMQVERDASGVLQRVAGRGDAGFEGDRESFIHVEVDRIPDAAQCEQLAADLGRVLGDVRLAVDDWQPMRERLQAILAGLDVDAPPVDAAELDEGRAFLRWLADDHFTFLGYRAHRLVVADGADALKVIEDSSLGILRDGEAGQLAAGFAALPAELRAHARRPELLVVTKSTSRSTVHRPGYLDYIGVKRFDAAGEVCGEDRFLGLFTSTAYSASPRQIPLLRRKLAEVMALAGLPPGGHSAKSLENILENHPRDELFQVAPAELLQTAMGVLHLGERQRFRLFVRRDAFDRFVSCLIYAPRENYNTELREKWQKLLVEAFDGSGSEFYVHLSESALVRVQLIVRTTPGRIPAVDVAELESRLAAAARRWSDELKSALLENLGEARGVALLRRFGDAFVPGYRADFDARTAAADVALIDGLGEGEGALAMNLYRPLEAATGELRFKLIRRGEPLTLSASLPMLEHMGLAVLDERSHRVAPEGEPALSIHDFGLRVTVASVDGADAEIDISGLHQRFEAAFAAVMRGEVENDDLNRLVIAAGLAHRDIVVLRACCKYLRQIGFGLSQAFIRNTLVAHAGLARALVELFRSRARSARGRCRCGRCGGDRARRGHRGRAGTRCQPLGGPGAAPAAGADPGDDADQLLAPRRGRRRAPLRLVQVRSRQGAGPARAEADVRNLRLLAALRGRAPAWRQGGTRRPALVGPAGRLPHRGARPGQGADGEEHRHRAGRLEGGVRAEAPAAAR